MDVWTFARRSFDWYFLLQISFFVSCWQRPSNCNNHINNSSFIHCCSATPPSMIVYVLTCAVVCRCLVRAKNVNVTWMDISMDVKRLRLPVTLKFAKFVVVIVVFISQSTPATPAQWKMTHSNFHCLWHHQRYPLWPLLRIRSLDRRLHVWQHHHKTRPHQNLRVWRHFLSFPMATSRLTGTHMNSTTTVTLGLHIKIVLEIWLWCRSCSEAALFGSVYMFGQWLWLSLATQVSTKKEGWSITVQVSAT